MATTAQFLQLGPFLNPNLQGSAKLYHYAAGTSTDKDIWSDRSKVTALAQPFIADANGMFNFFADGLYKLVIKDTNDVTLYTLDNWLIVDFSAPTFGEGNAITAASTTTVGPEVFAHITGSTTMNALSGTIPWFWGVFDGTPLLTASGSLILPGGVNKQTGANDVALFLNEGSGVWRLASYVQYDGQLVHTEDSRTNTVDVVSTLRATTTGTPAASIGVGQLYQAESADENPSDFGQLEFVASDVGSGTEDTHLQVLLRVAGAALTSCYRFVATGAFNAIFTHANTAARTYTLQNSSDTLVGRDTTDTLTNKTISGASNTFPFVAHMRETQPANASVTDQTAEQTVYTYSLPGGILDTNRCVHLRAILTATLGGDYTWRLKYGGTTMCTFTITNVASTQPTIIEAWLYSDNGTSAQHMVATCSTSVSYATAEGTAAIDSTASQTILLTQAQSATGATTTKKSFIVVSY